MMNIVFMGTAKFGIPALERLHESDHRVMAVVTQPDRPRGRGLQVRPSPVKQAVAGMDLYIYQPEDVNEYEFVRELRALSPDVIVVAAYGQKLGNDILHLPRHCPLNIHPSLLPRYRGPAPVARAILNGETWTGATIIKVIPKMDAGPILGMTRVAIPPEATTPEMEAELASVGAGLLMEVLDRIERGAAVEIPQKEREATYARRFEKRHGKIDWRKPARRIVDFVRALQPFPGAFTFHRRRRLRLLKVRGEKTSGTSGNRPGTVIRLDADAFHVVCGDGTVTVLEIQPEGRKPMSSREFLNGRPLKVGDKLT